MKGVANDIKNFSGIKPQEKECVLLLPVHPTSLHEFRIMVRSLAEDGRFDPVMVVVPELESFFAGTDPIPEGISLVFLSGREDRESKSYQRGLVVKGNRWQKCRQLLEPLRHSLLGLLLETLHQMRYIRRYYLAARQILEERRPLALLVIGDRYYSAEPAFLRAAGEINCKRIIVPFANSGQEQLVRVRKDRPLLSINRSPHKLLKALLRRKCPQQIYDSEHGPLLFYSPAVTLSLLASRMLPKNPWVLGASGADLMGVSGEEDYERFAAMGVDASKLRMVGQPSLDQLYCASLSSEELRKKVVCSYGLDIEKRLVVCAVPQLAEHELLDWEAHWAEIRFLVSSLVESGQNILLSLHPKAEREKYEFLQEEYSAKLLRQPLMEILPSMELLVSTFSSTTRWAVLLGIPAVNVDFYGLNYKMYDHLEGVVKLNDRFKLGQTVRRILTNEEVYQDLREKQLRAAKQIAVFDGKASERIVDLIASGIE